MEGIPIARNDLIAKQLPSEHFWEGNIWQDPEDSSLRVQDDFQIKTPIPSEQYYFYLHFFLLLTFSHPRF